ncbi:hypothetical protein A2899_03960 [Candidatus Amesbacteria bacterium RIFCSPLOWO2_01_FULL_49_25]|uniref:TrpR like protein, YerC/YecD n=1 Tax=Candidatus Amesbacteria bacterium RIFCSPHIGHO2_01_FULL_48_32b TaxID=1797253 RepID=A0A1F4YH59_9BACT|nr:MAG: hypothetical protein A2876_00875 [Candidatus Amesbacteria bacterium RIFCSPHIGHO2_01_FULL_48_32b]OGD07430.1 MAG: hypothetical protein A2899_03960 [Candidatus Amesbacteria bacterium RIFCSPLOWO2_01_FULL_49_25]
MQISKRSINDTLEKQVRGMWYQLIADTKTSGEAQLVFDELLTETETTAISKRVAVAYWLSKKRSYENIKQNLKVSSATIASVQQGMDRAGWKLALRRVMADEWATKWNGKIKDWLKR